MRNKSALTEPVPIAEEAVNSATVAENENKGVDDGDSDSNSDSTQNHVPEDEEEVVEEPQEKTDKGAVELLGGVELYKLTDADKGRFKNEVTRLASRA